MTRSRLCAPMLIGLICVLSSAALIPSRARAGESTPAWYKALADTAVSGHLRLYDYARINDGGTPTDNNALAAGGDVVATSGSLAGFSLGLGFYTARNIPTGLRVNEVLVGPDHHLEALAEAYLQYKNPHVLASGGRQLIDTPWARGDMFTMLPRAFEGISTTVKPLEWIRSFNARPEFETHETGREINPAGPDAAASKGEEKPALSVFAARMFRYESRFNDVFTSGNRYTDRRTDGFFTCGIDWHQPLADRELFTRIWFYAFYDFAQLAYLESRYQPGGDDSGLSPLFGFQFVAEGNSGSRRLGSVDAQVLGALAGFSVPEGTLCLVGNWSPENRGSFRHGGMVHPYNDLSGTLFTDTMNDGISNLGPSYALGIKAGYNPVNHPVELSLSYVFYRAKYGFGGAAYATDGPFGFPDAEPVKNQSQWAVDAGAAYHFKMGETRTLTVKNTIGIRDYANSPTGPFIDNRFAVIYPFSLPGLF